MHIGSCGKATNAFQNGSRFLEPWRPLTCSMMQPLACEWPWGWETWLRASLGPLPISITQPQGSGDRDMRRDAWLEERRHLSHWPRRKKEGTSWLPRPLGIYPTRHSLTLYKVYLKVQTPYRIYITEQIAVQCNSKISPDLNCRQMIKNKTGKQEGLH